MIKSLKVSLIAGCLMVSSAAVTKALVPTHKLADHQPQFQLAQIIPERFGEWQVDTSIVPLQVDPDTQAQLDKIYNQLLSRTYVNRDGERIMLSIAYGGDQSDGMQVHWPETCYTAQGFQVKKTGDEIVDTGYGSLPVRRLNAVVGSRYEPITYWITLGDKATMPGKDLKLTQLRYGLAGTVPDGMLVRVSNLSREPEQAYVLQQRFVTDLLGSLDPVSRKRLIGSGAVSAN